MAPNVAKNDFESVVSRLEWNIENWPGRRLDRVIDNANYTCASTGNLVSSEGVSSTTYFRVECKLQLNSYWARFFEGFISQTKM